MDKILKIVALGLEDNNSKNTKKMTGSNSKK